MDARTRAELTQALRRKRAALLKQFFDAEADLRSVAEEREAELEERAQEERAARVLARLDDRSLGEVQKVHTALQRMIDGTYGTCLDCRHAIPVARLRAVPTATCCLECARVREDASAGAPEATETRHPGGLPPDLEPLLDREVQEALRELVREDQRVDMDELRIVCRHGVVLLEGAVPNEAEHQILRKLVTDVAGCEEMIDHVRVDELLWERPDRTPPARFESVGTEDVVESTEEGLDYVAPDRPLSEEE